MDERFSIGATHIVAYKSPLNSFYSKLFTITNHNYEKVNLLCFALLCYTTCSSNLIILFYSITFEKTKPVSKIQQVSPKRHALYTSVGEITSPLFSN